MNKKVVEVESASKFMQLISDFADTGSKCVVSLQKNPSEDAEQFSSYTTESKRLVIWRDKRPLKLNQENLLWNFVGGRNVTRIKELASVSMKMPNDPWNGQTAWTLLLKTNQPKIILQLIFVEVWSQAMGGCHVADYQCFWLLNGAPALSPAISL